MNYRKFLLICVSMCMLLGCSKQSASDDGTNTKSEQDVTTVLDNIPKTFQRKDGNVVFDAEVKLNAYDQEKGLVTATAHLKKADNEKALALLWQEKDGKYIEEGYESENEYGEKVITMCGSNADNTVSFQAGPYSSVVSYSGTGTSHITGAFRLQKKEENYNADKYSLTDELDFMTREDAFSKLESALKQIGFDFEKEYSAYALDAETMEKEEYHMSMDGGIDKEEYKEQWTRDDDCYYFAIRQNYRGLPIHYAYAGVFTNYGPENAPVQAIFSKDGIMELNVDHIYEMSSEEMVEQLIEPEQAAEVASKKYNSILGDITYQISQIELVYIVDVAGEKGSYKLKPAWILMGTQSDGSDIQTIIDAQTGKEVILWTEL